jgi:hypothetical protein
MVRLWLLVACFVFSAVKAQAASPVAQVRIEIVADGIQATYRLSKSTTRFDFAPADIERDGNFEVITPEIQYALGSVTSRRPFRRFVLRVKNASTLYDGKYAPSIAIGEGRVLHAYSLKGALEAWDTRLTFVLPRGFIRSSPATASPDGNVFIGPSSYLKDRGTFVFIAPPDLPVALEGLIANQFETSIATYTSKLRQGLPSKPIVIAQLSSELRGYQGNVTDGFVTHLRFAPVGWETLTPDKLAYFQTFIPHEVFHFWNGGIISSSGAPMWLTEGSAEYASRLITIGVSPDSSADLNHELSKNLNDCSRALGQFENAAFDKVDFIPASVRYPCGMVMMWAADMRVRRDSNSQRTFFDVWADIVARGMARDNRSYSLVDFEQLVITNGGQSVESIRQLREESGPLRFGAFIDALKSEGAIIERASTIHSRRSAIIQHMLSQSCEQLPGKSIGYGLDGDIVTLDTHERCGEFSGRPTLTHIDGFDINQVTPADFAGVQSKCASNLPLAFRFGDGRSVEVVCKRALANAATSYSVISW